MGRTRRPHGAPSRVQPPSADPDLLPSADPDLVELIEGIRELRRTIDTDLTTTAAALDAGRPDVAHDIVAGALSDVAAFRAAAIARLDAEAAESVPEAAALTTAVRARPRRLQSRRARALIAIPTIPLVGALAMGGAAAIGALSTPTHHHAPAATRAITQPIAHPTATPTSASTTLARLERVVSNHPKSSQVLVVADDLHKQLTHIIATAPHNSTKLDVVSQLLTTEQQVLKSNSAPAASLALAASQQVSKLLQQSSSPLPVLTLTSPTAPPSSHASATPTKSAPASSKKAHHSTSTSSQHHKRSAHRKHKTAPTTHTPTPSNPLFGEGVFGTLQ